MRPRRSTRRPPGDRAPKKSSAQPLQPSTDVPDITSFLTWPLVAQVQEAIAAMGITTPTPIQRLAIGPVLEGKDVIAKAETGTGKTLAFGAPMMSKIEAGRASVLGLVLCPTRELAQQVAGVLEKLGASRGLKVALVVGGEPMPPQIDALKAGAQVVVGTPGRVIDLYGQRFLSFPWTEFVVLDEADQMLEIGFIDDVRKILSYTPDERQTMLFSATFPDEVLRLAREATRTPVEVATAAGLATVKTIDQSWIPVTRSDRSLLLTRLIEQSSADDVFLVFCDRRTEVDVLMRQLERMPFSVKALHGGFDQASRFRVMSAFRTGEVKALVATDVASRGLDVHLVTHVVNYGVPRDVEDYTHRIGRTGRAGRSGTAITLVAPEQMGRWNGLQRQMKWTISEHEPPGRTGRGPAQRGWQRERDSGRFDRDATRMERLAARGEREAAQGERESTPTERVAARGEREATRTERPATRVEREGARAEQPPARVEREAGRRERPSARGERETAGGERTARREPQRETHGAPRAAHPPRTRAAQPAPVAAEGPERPRREMSSRARLAMERSQEAPSPRVAQPQDAQAEERPRRRTRGKRG